MNTKSCEKPETQIKKIFEEFVKIPVYLNNLSMVNEISEIVESFPSMVTFEFEICI